MGLPAKHRPAVGVCQRFVVAFDANAQQQPVIGPSPSFGSRMGRILLPGLLAEMPQVIWPLTMVISAPNILRSLISAKSASSRNVSRTR